jgi:ABC-type oligopeptide transport system substrate-binding subunit
MRRPVPLALAMLGAGAALVVATGPARPAAGDSSARASRGGTVRIMSPDDLGHVDPALAYTTDEWLIEYATCAKLFNHPDEPGTAGARILPEVVRSYTVSRDGRVYTFDLRRSFRFHTGAPVTAQSFADAFERDADPRMGSPATSYMREIEGAAAMIDGDAKRISGIRVLGRYRLRVRLTKPLGDLTARLTMPFFCPILPNTPIDPHGIDNPPGSGPYYIAERIVNQRTVLERNPYYRGSRPANVARIVYTTGQTIEACLRAVEDNQADLCGEPGAPREAFRTLAEKYGLNRPGGRLFARPSLGTWFVAFNHERRAFKGPGQIPLKKAINFAIDRPALTRSFGFLAGTRTDQMLPPALGRAFAVYPLSGANVSAARRWYALTSFKPMRLVLYSWSIPPVVTASQVIVFNLKQLGIGVEVKYFAPQTTVEKASTPGEPYDLMLFPWTADYADPAGFLAALLAPDGVGNVARFDDPGIRRRVEAAERVTGKARKNAWAALELELMRDNPPWAPFMHTRTRAFVSRSLGCFVEHPIYRVDLVAVCKK